MGCAQPFFMANHVNLFYLSGKHLLICILILLGAFSGHCEISHYLIASLVCSAHQWNPSNKPIESRKMLAFFIENVSMLRISNPPAVTLTFVISLSSFYSDPFIVHFSTLLHTSHTEVFTDH